MFYNLFTTCKEKNMSEKKCNSLIGFLKIKGKKKGCRGWNAVRGEHKRGKEDWILQLTKHVEPEGRS